MFSPFSGVFFPKFSLEKYQERKKANFLISLLIYPKATWFKYKFSEVFVWSYVFLLKLIRIVYSIPG